MYGPEEVCQEISAACGQEVPSPANRPVVSCYRTVSNVMRRALPLVREARTVEENVCPVTDIVVALGARLITG